MKKKRSEESLHKMMKQYKYKPMKGRDRGYVSCPQCHNTIQTCPKCKKSMLLPKASTRLDYLVAMDWVEIECKQGEETWSLHDFTENQENLLPLPVEETQHPRWIFVELGTGRAPNGKEAYLIPADAFLVIRKNLEEHQMKSVRFRRTERSKLPEARHTFGKFGLEWVTNRGWNIPEGHEFWNYTLDIRAGFTIIEGKAKDDKVARSSSAPPRLGDMGDGLTIT